MELHTGQQHAHSGIHAAQGEYFQAKNPLSRHHLHPVGTVARSLGLGALLSFLGTPRRPRRYRKTGVPRTRGMSLASASFCWQAVGMSGRTTISIVFRTIGGAGKRNLTGYTGGVIHRRTSDVKNRYGRFLHPAWLAISPALVCLVRHHQSGSGFLSRSGFKLQPSLLK